MIDKAQARATILAAKTALSNGAHTRTELADMLDLSERQVGRVLGTVKAEHVPGTWPKAWRMPTANAVLAMTERTITLDMTGDDLASWDVARERVAEVLATRIDPSMSPGLLADTLSDIAGMVGTVAWNLHQHRDAPDWHVLAGGPVLDVN